MQGIKRNMAIKPSRGEPVGVDVEVEPFGPPQTGKSETGAIGDGYFVEFDLPEGAVPTPTIGPRNTRKIPTDEPLDISPRNPEFHRIWPWFY